MKNREKYIDRLWEIVEEPDKGFALLFAAMQDASEFTWNKTTEIMEIAIKFHGQEYFDVCKLMACFLLAEQGEL